MYVCFVVFSFQQHDHLRHPSVSGSDPSGVRLPKKKDKAKGKISSQSVLHDLHAACVAGDVASITETLVTNNHCYLHVCKCVYVCVDI